MKRIYTAESLVDGQLVVDMLLEAGVPAQLFNQNALGGLGELPVTPPEVWIRRDPDEEKAKDLVRGLLDQPWSDNSVDCETCGESNPDTFELCWQCNKDLRVIS